MQILNLKNTNKTVLDYYLDPVKNSRTVHQAHIALRQAHSRLKRLGVYDEVYLYLEEKEPQVASATNTTPSKCSLRVDLRERSRRLGYGVFFTGDFGFGDQTRQLVSSC